MNIQMPSNSESDFEAWLTTSNESLLESTSESLDIEAMLTCVKRDAVVNIRTAQSKPRHVSRRLARSAAGTVAGALALKAPGGSTPRRAKVLTFPSKSAAMGHVDMAPVPPGLREGLEYYVELATIGDRHAIEHLLAAVRPLVVRYCRARLGRTTHPFTSADDVAQEACLTVLTALPDYRDQGRPFLAFVYGIAAHKVADAHRAAALRQEEPVAQVPDSEDTSETTPEQQALRDELSSRMAVLLRVLPEKQREILLLRVVVGLSTEETAEAVGSSPGAVRVAQHRALMRLRSALSADSGKSGSEVTTIP